MIDISTASTAELIIAEQQGVRIGAKSIKLTILPTAKPRREHLVMTQTKGLRTNTNRQGQSMPHATHI
jgi:hypothetical protein